MQEKKTLELGSSDQGIELRANCIVASLVCIFVSLKGVIRSFNTPNRKRMFGFQHRTLQLNEDHVKPDVHALLFCMSTQVSQQVVGCY